MPCAVSDQPDLQLRLGDVSWAHLGEPTVEFCDRGFTESYEGTPDEGIAANKYGRWPGG